jgi:Domain of unknown function (DUF4148)
MKAQFLTLFSVKRSIVLTMLATGALCGASGAFAQQAVPDAKPVTRAQVLQELESLESVNYDPSWGNGPNYPFDIQAAQQRLAQKQQRDAHAVPPIAGKTAMPEGIAKPNS